MKTANLARNCHHRSLWAALSALLLTSCSSLQIDVDVYKGPLVNEHEIQLKQFAASAISAKQLIIHMRNTAKSKLQECIIGAASAANLSACTTVDFASKFLNEIADLYRNDQDEAAGQPQFHGQKMEDLTLKLNNALATEDPELIKKARAELTDALILFAQKVLFTVNNQVLFKELNSDGYDVAVLQSLGNTILIHANDLQRQSAREVHFTESLGAERFAIERGFRMHPSTAYDYLLSAVASSAIPVPANAKDAAPLEQQTSKQREQLKAVALAQDELKTSIDAYRAGLPSLVAAYHTLHSDAPTGIESEAIGDDEQKATTADRAAIHALYKEQPLTSEESAYDEAIKPLQAWLENETSRKPPLISQRQTRLKLVSQYLTTYKSVLPGNAPGTVAKRSDVLEKIRQDVDRYVNMAKDRIDTDRKKVDAQQKEIAWINKDIANAERRYAARAELRSAAALSTPNTNSVLGVLKHIQKDVLKRADAAGLVDARGVQELISERLNKLSASSTATSTPTKTDVELAQSAIAKLALSAAPPCTDFETRPNGGPGCGEKTPIDLIDNLIATLRAQRINALASGNAPVASNLQNAINAAYEQRSSMVYLRPASDYLRSVYSANAFQEKGEAAHDNMLLDWLQYLNPIDNKKEKGRQQLEKLNWQNINKVTLAGGGATNYVLAKDDVGNWYVKAYSADPEAIIKSATSLALFNSGKAINTNLLRRYEIQRTIDDTKTGDRRKTELENQLKESNSQDGGALLKVKERYATRYRADTERHATELHESLIAMANKLDIALNQREAPKAPCTIEEAKAGLGNLDVAYLDGARTRLRTLLSSKGADKASTEDLEKALQSGMTSVYLYSERVYVTLKTTQPNECNSWRSGAAEDGRKDLRTQLNMFANERKKSIERYEEALSSIADIATEK